MKKKILFTSPLILLLVFFVSLRIPIPKERLNPAPVISLRILDRQNVLLREVLSDEGGCCRWVELEQIAPDLIAATIAAEDRNFYNHLGINCVAIMRAFFQNIKSGRIVSGASTITQQLIRNLYHFRRTIFSKIHEAWLALRLENTLSKEEILVQYLNRISYGNQAFGIEAASRLYFDKPSNQLSLAESAFLAGLPRSPTNLNPYRAPKLAKQRQESILRQIRELGFSGRAEFDRALNEPLLLSPLKDQFKAPHFCDFILNQFSSKEKHTISVIQTTCDFALQEKVDILVKNHVDSLEDRGITNAAALVLDNRTGDILCMVGSKDFFDVRHDGQVNGAVARRQPGSALKPFTYGLALEKGKTAADIIYDGPVQYSTPGGPYRPRNYDKKYHGPVRLREALACSYNVPAVSVLESIGPDLLYIRLKELGFESLNRGPSYYGIGLTLGNGEVTLLELVQAYATIARGGLWKTYRAVLRVSGSDNNAKTLYEEPKEKEVFSPQVAYILTHILSDKDARIPAFGYNSALALPFPCAVKTGTSKNFRDNWAIGYTPDYTVGVWVGNFDSGAMFNVSGVTGCGPLFRDIMLFLEGQSPSHDFLPSKGLMEVNICPLSGQRTVTNCPGVMKEIFISGTEPQSPCSLHKQKPFSQTEETSMPIGDSPPGSLAIIFPIDGDTFKIDPILRRTFQTLQFKIAVSDNF
ncbi:MAG: penicillin-binding protein 1C, partial [Candidatus Aminicenantes bacterium]